MADHNPGTSSSSKPTTARSVLPSLGAVIAEFALVCLLVALVPVTVYLDTAVLGDGVSEDSLTEHLHNTFLAIAAAIFMLGAYKHVGMRGYLTLVATLFACMFLREYDAALDRIQHGFWIYPALVTLAVGSFIAWRNRGTTLLPMLHHLQTRSATFVYIGVVLLLFFSRTFGTGALWEAVMGAAYDPQVKTTVQEGTELLAYLLIAYGAVLSHLHGYGAQAALQERRL
ncbi:MULTISPECIES: hypothetical protein [Sulfitobacter]|jgi:hypothetical protein|uniref:C4-dicarboxylate ABC transporter permease n=1 Tax=Sulfitobacter profundi TaxID=2679961 RepID=A0ABW1YWZ6_9RHOB|nr:MULTISPECIES: hypothetical protein [Sulfitobacter]UWR37217.1 hypothetical protein K3762_15920 [Sulfitobacter sp. W074]